MTSSTSTTDTTKSLTWRGCRVRLVRNDKAEAVSEVEMVDME